MSNDIRVSRPNDTTLFDKLVFKSDKAPVEEPNTQVEDNNEIETQDVSETSQTNRGNIPSSGVSFDDPIVEQEPQEEQLPEVNMEDTGELPELQDEGLGENDLPDINGNQEFPNDETKPEDYKPETNKEHSTSKALYHFYQSTGTKFVMRKTENYIAKKTAEVLTEDLTKAFGKKIVENGTKKVAETGVKEITKGVTKGLDNTVVKLTSEKLLGQGVKTIGVREAAKESGNLYRALVNSGKYTTETVLEGGAKKILPNTLNALKKTAVGSGETVLENGLKKGTEKGLEKFLKTVGDSGGAIATETIAKTVTKKAASKTSQELAKQLISLAGKKGSSAAGKALAQELIEQGAKKGGDKALAKLAQEFLEQSGKKGVTELGQNLAKQVLKQATKETTKAGAKTGVKTASEIAQEVAEGSLKKVATTKGVQTAGKVAKVLPYVNTAIGVGFTAWDAYDSYQKFKDPKASTASKVLSVVTVAADVTSVVAGSTGKGKPIGWVATGVGIASSIASDYLR
ncbi:MAG: hypothetical protein U0354_02195 [Candidatus Sericytochromatia bacterium]